MTTWPGPAVGDATSSSTSDSGGPNALHSSAFMGCGGARRAGTNSAGHGARSLRQRSLSSACVDPGKPRDDLLGHFVAKLAELSGVDVFGIAFHRDRDRFGHVLRAHDNFRQLVE